MLKYFARIAFLVVGAFLPSVGTLTAAEVLDDLESLEGWTFRQQGFVPESGIKKQGESAARIHLFQKSYASLRVPIGDWEPFDAVSFWMYSEEENGAVLGLSLSTPQGDSAWHYFYYKIPINWSGWRHFVLRKSEFRKVRDPDWGNIRFLKFSLEWDWSTPSPDHSVVIDDIQLLGPGEAVLK